MNINETHPKIQPILNLKNRFFGRIPLPNVDTNSEMRCHPHNCRIYMQISDSGKCISS